MTGFVPASWASPRAEAKRCTTSGGFWYARCTDRPPAAAGAKLGTHGDIVRNGKNYREKAGRTKYPFKISFFSAEISRGHMGNYENNVI